MASKAVRNFALNILYAWEETPEEPDGTPKRFRKVLDLYNERVGAANKLTFAQFKQYVKEAWEEGHLKLGGAYVPGMSDKLTGISKDETIQLKEGKYNSYWSRFVDVKSSIKRIVESVDNEAFEFVNQNIHDAFIRHQIHLLRLAGAHRNEMTALLDKTEKDLAEQIRKRLDGHKGAGSLGTRRLQLLEEYVRFIRGNAWSEVNKAWQKNLVDLAKQEPGFIAGLIQGASPVALSFILPDASTIQSLVKHNPFEGKVLKDWAKNIEEADIQRILGQIRIGMLQGESSADIARRIVGSAQMKGTDGVTEITRRNAAALTRTAVIAISHSTRDAFYEENDDLFNSERYVATLDSRTTPMCRANDGKVFTRGIGPRPPIHFNCRSIRVPFFQEGVFGDRPARNFTQKQLLREFADDNDLYLPSSRDKLPRGYKSSFDDYARKRKRELTSIVPASEDFGTFLRRQTVPIQNDILGPTRATLFRTGKLQMDKFVDRTGKELTLAQLAKRYRDIFKAAGLNPEDYL